jgi:hypothetical protein
MRTEMTIITGGSQSKVDTNEITSDAMDKNASLRERTPCDHGFKFEAF